MADEKKLRHSRQRDMIYQYLLGTKAHPSADMIYAELKEDIKGLSLGTVYRNLKLLEELKKVRKVASFNDTDRYDACCCDHVHFLCTQCGSIYDVDSADVDTIRKSIMLNDNFCCDNLTLTINGTCADCNKNKNLA